MQFYSTATNLTTNFSTSKSGVQAAVQPTGGADYYYWLAQDISALRTDEVWRPLFLHSPDYNPPLSATPSPWQSWQVLKVSVSEIANATPIVKAGCVIGIAVGASIPTYSELQALAARKTFGPCYLGANICIANTNTASRHFYR